MGHREFLEDQASEAVLAGVSERPVQLVRRAACGVALCPRWRGPSACLTVAAVACRRILLFPGGNNVQQLSVYLDVADSATLPQGWSRQAHFTLTVQNQKDHTKTVVKGAHPHHVPRPPLAVGFALCICGHPAALHLHGGRR